MPCHAVSCHAMASDRVASRHGHRLPRGTGTHSQDRLSFSRRGDPGAGDCLGAGDCRTVSIELCPIALRLIELRLIWFPKTMKLTQTYENVFKMTQIESVSLNHLQ